MDIKRLTAYKVPIKDIVSGKYVPSEEKFVPGYVLTPYGLKLSRVRIMGTVVNHFVSDDKKYAFIVIDDGTETIRSKAFQDILPLEKLKKGALVDFIGKIREYNDERYLLPEIVINVKDPNMETLRRLEAIKFIQDFRKKNSPAEEETKTEIRTDDENKSQDMDIEKETEKGNDDRKETEETQDDSKNAKAEVLKTIRALDEGDGVDYAVVVEKVNLDEKAVEDAINELLEEGSCYEPRAGKIKVL